MQATRKTADLSRLFRLTRSGLILFDSFGKQENKTEGRHYTRRSRQFACCLSLVIDRQYKAQTGDWAASVSDDIGANQSIICRAWATVCINAVNYSNFLNFTTDHSRVNGTMGTHESGKRRSHVR